MATCPRCPDTGLQHTLVSDSLPAHACPSCDGLLVGLVAYRRWRETHGTASTPAAGSTGTLAADDARDALSCSKCRRIMTKYRISPDAPNRIDFCAGCEDIWLDDGEWEMVELLAGSDHLANIVTQPWQYRLRGEALEKMERKRLAARLGDDFDKVRELANWLHDHEARDEIFAYLLRKSY